MPPKREFSRILKTEEELEVILNEKYQKLVMIDLHSSWSGPCIILKEYYKQLNTNIDDLKSKVEIVSADKSLFSKFDNYNLGSRPKILFYLNGKLIKEIDGPNSVKMNEIIEANMPKE